MKRVLLGSMNVGGGHNALRDSFATSLKMFDAEARLFEPILFDSVDTKVSRFYESTVHMASWIQGLVFQMGRTSWGVRLSVLVNGQLLREAKQALLQHRPEIVVSSHFLLSMMFAKARRELEMDVPVVNAIPDYGESTLAFYPEAGDIQSDYVIAMDRRTHEHLVQVRGVPPARAHLSGFLPRPAFVEASRELGNAPRLPRERRRALAHALKAEHSCLSKFDPDKQTVIFLGGSAWTSKTLPVIDELLGHSEYLETINAVVVCGKNEEFFSLLQERLGSHPRFSVFGFVSPELMAQLLGISDLPVLGSLAPASMHELLEMRCGPLMLFHYIPGAEEPHSEYIREQQIGLYEPDERVMVDLLMQATGYKPPTAGIFRLLQVFPERAKAIRADHARRARQLGAFLALVGRVVPEPRLEAEPHGPAAEFGIPRERVS
jgi:processive 1,2-diacylglycerol beta-glucosyltransferase